MPKRRKILAGLGSIAAGSAAAMGTGAFETAASERTTEVNVASDASGFVEIIALNNKYASGTSDGQLELEFNADSGLGVFDGSAQGLNPNSRFEFPEVFQIGNTAAQGDQYIAIEAEGFDVESLELTADGETANAVSSGTSLRAADYHKVDNLPKLQQPDAVKVDVAIETKDDSVTGAVGGTLTIYAAPGSSRDELADVL